MKYLIIILYFALSLSLSANNYTFTDGVNTFYFPMAEELMSRPKEKPQKKIVTYFKIKRVQAYGSELMSTRYLAPILTGCCNNFGHTKPHILFNALINARCFDHIEMYSEHGGLLVILKDKPCISSIKIYGDDTKKAKSLLKKHLIKVGILYDHGALALCKNRLKEWYTTHGYLDSEIIIRLIKEKNTNSIHIRINIIKNKTFKIKKVDITGSRLLSKKSLSRLITLTSSKWWGLFSKTNVYTRIRLSKDIKKLRKFYVIRGFKDFQIKYIKIIKKKNEKGIKIFIKISEGNRYKIRRFLIAHRNKRLQIRFHKICYKYVKKSRVYSKGRIKRIKRLLQRNLSDDRDIFSYKVKSKTISSFRHGVTVIFYIKEILKPKVRRIKILGNYVTSDLALRKFFTHLEDSRLQIRKVHQAKREILKRGYAKSIQVGLKRNRAKPYEADIIVRIKEQKINKVAAGCIYSEKDGMTFNIHSELINFLGTGRDISLIFLKNQNLIDYNFTIVTPKFMGFNMDLTYHLFYKVEATNKNVLSEYSTNALGISMLYTFRFSPGTRFHCMFGFDRTYIRVPGFKFVPYLKKFINTYGVKYKEYYITTVFVHSTLSKKKRFKNGIYHKIACRITTPVSKLKYYIINYDLMIYKSLSRDFIFQLNMNISYGNKYGDTQWYPFFKHFFLKGKNNIRGYGEKTLGPRNHIKELNLGGNLLISIKMSMYFPLPIIGSKRLKSSVFFDIGQTYDTTNDFCSRPAEFLEIPYNSFLKYSCGASVIWTTPLRIPIEITFAYPLNASILDKKKFFIFSIGMTQRR